MTKKPDGLVKYHENVKAVVEYKQPSELNTAKQIEKTKQQELPVAAKLCKLLILTDGQKSVWINALNGDPVQQSDGRPVELVFHPFAVRRSNDIEHLIDAADSSLTKSNSRLSSPKLVDPTQLATRLWQTIWVATGKSPVKCLYNVVELFIFKYLSDLAVLSDDISFDQIYSKSRADAQEALKFYARNSRQRIYELFPKGEDGTTVINGTIFVNEQGHPNLSQSILFRRSLQHLAEYTEQFGSLVQIDKQFKTRLYESFLKQEAEALGQYFTPRRIVQAVIRAAGLDSPSSKMAGLRICDPFCGVGGFLLEILNLNEAAMRAYTPDSKTGRVSPPFTLHGFDKGFERDDERTIILAKANMLIYLSEVLFQHPSCTTHFADAFNRTFRLFKDNLGTFGHIIEDDAARYDFILSNPPYVTSGSSIIKEEISQNTKTANAYPINAMGLEGLSLEWIIRSLKPGGRAFVVIPDGILARVSDRKLRSYILRECYLDAIISLPERTFFANFENTYILVITRKNHPDDNQAHPVFGYLACQIGEKLTSVNREEIDDDDLPEMELLFKAYSANPSSASLIDGQSPRCKLFDIRVFANESHWVIDRWWTSDELIAAGRRESIRHVSSGGISDLADRIKDIARQLDEAADIDISDIPMREVSLGDPRVFNLFIGKRLLRSELSHNNQGFPVFSANVHSPMGYFPTSNISDFSRGAILWGIDGNFEFRVAEPGFQFATTDHCGCIDVLREDISLDYLWYALVERRRMESYDRSFRANLANMKTFAVQIPIQEDGHFDMPAQVRIAAAYAERATLLTKLNSLRTEFDEQMAHFITARA